MRRFSDDLERETRRLVARGHSLREVGRLVECSKHAVTNVMARPPADPTAWDPSPVRLSLAEREVQQSVPYGYAWSYAGERRLRGIRDPVPLFRARRLPD